MYTVRRMKERGEDLAPKYGGGRPLKMTLPLLRIIKDTYKDDPMVPYNHTAGQLGVSARTISRAVKELGMKSYVIRWALMNYHIITARRHVTFGCSSCSFHAVKLDSAL